MEHFASGIEKYKLDYIIDSIGDGIVVGDKDLNIFAVNSKFSSLYGLTPQQMIGKNAIELYPDFEKSVFYDVFQYTLKTGKPYSRVGYSLIVKTLMVIRCFKIDESSYCMTAHLLNNNNYNKTGHIPTYDTLTSLPNRFSFEEDVQQLILNKIKHSIIFLDVEKFQLFNDKFGTMFGDFLLMEIAARIKMNISNTSRLYRYNGDQFIVINTNVIDDVNEAVTLRKCFNEPFIVNGNKYTLNIKTSSTVYTGVDNKEEDFDSSDIVFQLEKAMNFAKIKKMAHVKYNPALIKDQSDILDLAQDLKVAFINNEFEMLYQPQISGINEKVMGVEALIRWNHPRRGLVTPDKFLTVAEEYGLSKKLDKYVINQVFSRYFQINSSVYQKFNISINLSPESISDKDIVEYICSEAEKHKVENKYITIEITEGSIMNNVELSVTNIKKLKSCGFKIAIDDFGTGYSSLEYLLKYPADYLKIDKVFLKDIDKEMRNQDFLNNIIKFSKSLNMSIIAEGAETTSHVNLLKQMGCNFIQGYHYSKPLSLNDCKKYIKEKGIFSTNVIQ